MTDYDIAIIGAGPAGATLARLLDAQYRVIVIDKKSTKGGFMKPCGGLLAPDAQKALKSMGLHWPNDVLVTPQIASVRTIDLNSGLERHYPRDYINMDRHKFDMWLISLIPKRVDLRLNSLCRSIQAIDDGYSIDFIEAGEQKTVSCRIMVGADGANSIVRRTFFKRNIKQYTAIQQHFHQPDAKPQYSCIFDNRLTDSYAWMLQKGDYFIIGAALPAHKSRENFELLKERLVAYGYNFDNLVKTEACLALRGRAFCGAGKVYLIGEAGAFISPSSLEGISYALNTARELSEALNKTSPYTCRSTRLKLLLKYLKMPFMYNRWLRKLVMKSGVASC